MVKLDQRDIKILSILQREGRITKTALAARVNLSPTPCWDRLKRLEREGIIEGYGARVNIARLGSLTTVMMTAEIKSHQAQDFKRFETAVLARDEVQECWAVGGGIDYLLRVVTPSFDAYLHFVEHLLSGQTGLKHYTTYIVTRHVKSAAQVPDAVLANLRGV